MAGLPLPSRLTFERCRKAAAAYLESGDFLRGKPATPKGVSPRRFDVKFPNVIYVPQKPQKKKEIEYCPENTSALIHMAGVHNTLTDPKLEPRSGTRDRSYNSILKNKGSDWSSTASAATTGTAARGLQSGSQPFPPPLSHNDLAGFEEWAAQMKGRYADIIPALAKGFKVVRFGGTTTL